MSGQTFLDGRVMLYAGDCIDVLASLPENSVDSVVCDPPYHLTSIVKRFGAEGAAEAKAGATGAYQRASAGFMGKVWDGGDIAFQPSTWAALLTDTDTIADDSQIVAINARWVQEGVPCSVTLREAQQ